MERMSRPWAHVIGALRLAWMAAVIGLVLAAGCGGSNNSVDGGWLGTSPHQALFFQLSGSGGTGYLAEGLSGQTDHDNFVKVNADQTISFSFTDWGGGCLPSCAYQISGNTMTITGVGSNHSSWTLARAQMSDFERARSRLQS